MPCLYFAYGSNLAPERLGGRTGAHLLLAGLPCRLSGHRLAFNKRSHKVPGRVFANIVPASGHEVWGVAYPCTDQAFEALDIHEGVALGHYRRQAVQVQPGAGESLLAAFTYVAGPDFVCDEALPDPDYLGFIVDGARHHGLPQAYIEALVRHHAAVA